MDSGDYASILEPKGGYPGKLVLYVGNGNSIPVKYIGSTNMIGLNGSTIYLKDVLYSPCITKNLISAAKLMADNNVIVVFDSKVCYVKDKRTRQVLLQGTIDEGLC